MNADPSIDGPMDRPITRQCKAHRKNGARCRKPAMRGMTVCRAHGGAAPQTQRAARNRLLAAAEPLMAQLVEIALSSDNEVVRLRATMDALDRAGLTERGVATAGVAQPFDELLAGIIEDSLVDVSDEPTEPQALTASARRALPAAPPEADDYGDPEPELRAVMSREEMDRAASGAANPHAPQGASAHDPAWTDTYNPAGQVVQGEIVEGSVDPPAWVQERFEALNPNRVRPGYADLSR